MSNLKKTIKNSISKENLYNQNESMKNQYENEILNLKNQLSTQDILRKQQEEKIIFFEKQLQKKENMEYIFKLEHDIEELLKKMKIQERVLFEKNMKIQGYQKKIRKQPKKLCQKLGINSFQNSRVNSTNQSQITKSDNNDQIKTFHFTIDDDENQGLNLINRLKSNSVKKNNISNSQNIDFIHCLEEKLLKKDEEIENLLMLQEKNLNDNQQYQKKIENLREQNQNYIQENHFLIEEIDNLKHCNITLQNQLNENQESSKNQIKKIQGRSSIEINSFEQNIQKLFQEKQKMENTIENYQQKNQKLTKEIIQLKANHEAQKQELIVKNSQQLDIYKETISKQKIEIEKCQQEKQLLIQEIENKRQELLKEYLDLQQSNDKEIEKLNLQIRDLQKENKNINYQITLSKIEQEQQEQYQDVNQDYDLDEDILMKSLSLDIISEDENSDIIQTGYEDKPQFTYQELNFQELEQKDKKINDLEEEIQRLSKQHMMLKETLIKEQQENISKQKHEEIINSLELNFKHDKELFQNQLQCLDNKYQLILKLKDQQEMNFVKQKKNLIDTIVDKENLLQKISREKKVKDIFIQKYEEEIQNFNRRNSSKYLQQIFQYFQFMKFLIH